MSPRAVPGASKAEDAAKGLGRRDPYWPAQVTVLAAIGLNLDLPSNLTLQPGWVLPVLEGVLLVGLVASTPWEGERARPWRRRVAILLIGIVSAANLLSLGLLCHYLL